MLIIGLSPELSANRVGRYRVRRMRRAAVGAQWRRSGEVLPRPERTQGAGGDRSHRTRTLVRGVTGGVEVRAMGRRPGADSGQTSAEAQERPRGCATAAQITGGRSLSPGVGAECGESGCAPTLWHRHRLVQMRTRVMNQLQAIAMNEGVRRKKGLWSQRGREQLETLTLANWATRRRRDLLDLLDRLNPRIEELSEAIEPEAVQRPEVKRLMTPPGCRAPHRPSLCLDHWVSGAVPRRRADRQLPGAGSLRELQRRSPTAGTYQQARERSATFLAGGGGAGRSPLRPRVATSLPAPGDASPPRDRQGGDGTQARRRPLLDVA